MKNRKPLELKNVLLSYNIGLVFLSGYCFIQVSTINKNDN